MVEDTGPGIDPQDLPHLFERFYRGASRTSHGFGIGLSLTQRIVTGQGGTIQARNRPPGGTIRVTLLQGDRLMGGPFCDESVT